MSDLDNEEIEATKMLQEKSADELFDDLYYTKYNNPNVEIVYKKNEFHIIRFWKGNKTVIKQDEKRFLSRNKFR